MQLFETMRLEAGKIPRETYHLQRMTRSAEQLGLPFSQYNWVQRLKGVKDTYTENTYRLKVILSAEGILTTEIAPLTDKPFLTARLMEIDEQTPRWQRTNKTSERSHLHHHHQTDIVLFHNAEGKLLEFDIGNLVISYQAEKQTPRYEHDFLRGCMRQALLDHGEIIEADLTVESLKAAILAQDDIWMINSLREWMPVQFR
ncbi:aminodeoxychorismate lyase [Staphylococcus muscae]|uniref:Aminodeoxychorismate lyase n=1 Tax=Staphylococcus muscae TaxID=1294 RepID=A0A240BYB3_9STAP|nr:aminotransferase class IV [Staphylococcus muscae]AVQ34291.1 aminodeoxychorismate lyase [Staphylococcus muscae]PNZ02170.1 aminodeoxychorismate lyase [Staphylococcus muscae]GGA84507.1 aminodeoxychorismate lyase [Staphylococcus muscae]SNW00053.1 para-aminobenzoate synthase component I [Staphylococcus muscae]